MQHDEQNTKACRKYKTKTIVNHNDVGCFPCRGVRSARKKNGQKEVLYPYRSTTLFTFSTKGVSHYLVNARRLSLPFHKKSSAFTFSTKGASLYLLSSMRLSLYHINKRRSSSKRKGLSLTAAQSKASLFTSSTKRVSLALPTKGASHSLSIRLLSYVNNKRPQGFCLMLSTKGVSLYLFDERRLP